MRRQYSTSRKRFSFHGRKAIAIKYLDGRRARRSQSRESSAPPEEELPPLAEPGMEPSTSRVQPELVVQAQWSPLPPPPPAARRPRGSAWRQQRLDAWQPILTTGTVLPTFLLIGLLFVPIGVFLLVTSNSVEELIVDYTDCAQEQCPKGRVPCKCTVPFDLTEDFEKDVFLYYGLTNYFQNHRRYTKSKESSQLEKGELIEPSEDCEPFDYKNGKPIGPCGIIANSLFNDTFKLYYIEDTTTGRTSRQIPVPLNTKDIAWSTDKHAKYMNPENMSYAFDTYYAKPVAWPVSAADLDRSDPQNNGYLNEQFMVWMRVGAFSSFRKLYARVVHDAYSKFEDCLPKGRYSMNIEYNYPVTMFKGQKKFVLSNTSWMGGKSLFLGVVYIVVGVLILLLTAFLYYVHRKYGKSDDDFTTINSRTPYMSKVS